MRDGPRIWKVVRVDFPHADTAILAARPAVVIASPATTDVFGIIWVLVITSSRHTKWADDVLVTDLTQAGLSRPSVIRTGKIAAIDRRHVRALGRLSEPDRASVRGRLRLHLGPAQLICLILAAGYYSLNFPRRRPPANGPRR